MIFHAVRFLLRKTCSHSLLLKISRSREARI